MPACSAASPTPTTGESAPAVSLLRRCTRLVRGYCPSPAQVAGSLNLVTSSALRRELKYGRTWVFSCVFADICSCGRMVGRERRSRCTGQGGHSRARRRTRNSTSSRDARPSPRRTCRRTAPPPRRRPAAQRTAAPAAAPPAPAREPRQRSSPALWRQALPRQGIALFSPEL